MKKALFILAAMALAFSCAKEIAPETLPAGEKVTIRVSMPEEPLSRVSLTEAADHQSIALAWEAGDKISVNGGEFTIKDGFSAHEAEFEGTEPAGTPYTIIYPGKYASIDDFNARSYEAQAQSGNSSTAHLEFNAALVGVSEYAEPKFDPEWAADKGGSLIQNAVLQMRLQLPEGVTDANFVTLSASREIFPITNEGDLFVKEQTLTLSDITLPANRILEAFMMVSAAGVTIQDNDELTVIVGTSAGVFLRKITLSAQNWTGGGQYTLQLKVQDENSFDIYNVNDLLEFQEGVNSGSMLWQTVNANLKADLDLSSISDWTPIGNGRFINANPYTVSGNTFRGVFDGGNHVLKNLKINGTPEENAPYGFFGILDGATVKNLVFGAESGDSGFFKVTPLSIMEAGIVAGLSRASTIQNVTNYNPMSILEHGSSDPAYFGMVGYVWGNAAGRSHLDNVDNYGEINAVHGNNAGNGSTGIQVGGIAGFSNTSGSSIKNLIENCDNYGNMTSSTGRTAGILAAANTRTILSGCVNRGNILNTCSNGRIAGVCVILGDGSSMVDCSNYGEVVVTKSDTHVGGLVCLINKDNITVSGGGNHALIVGDITTYRGTLIANINTFSSMSGMVAGGAIASYNGGDYQYIILTEDNYMNYIGKVKTSSDMSKITDITFEAWDGYPAGTTTLISNAEELVAFANKVNAGEFAAADVAKLTADIDCSSITSWTPIGNCTMSTWSATAMTTSGNLFAGTFDGQNHSIKNLAMNFASSGGFAAYGFFGGIGDGATVKNLTFDASCSMNVSAAYGSSFGVLAGIVTGATISNVKNYAPVTGGGTSALGNNNSAGRTMVGGLIGEVHPNEIAANISNLHNYADIGSASTEFSRGANTGNGANGFEVGGIAGFSTTTPTSLLVTFTNCVNDGNIYTNAGRSSGLVAGCNRYTKLLNCTNNGDVTSSVSGTFRLANITCIAGAGSILDGCINTGDLIAPNCVSVAGVLCLVNDATVQIKNCGSHGATIVGKSVNLSGNQTYNGVLFGYCNNAATFSNCSVSGKIGTSLDNLVTLTAENYFPFVGQHTANATSVTADNITFYAQ